MPEDDLSREFYPIRPIMMAIFADRIGIVRVESIVPTTPIQIPSKRAISTGIPLVTTKVFLANSWLAQYQTVELS